MAGWCCMCCCDGETMDHLLMHCNIVHALWSFVFKAFGVLWVLPHRVVDLLFEWRNWFGKHNLSLWNLVPLCLMWTVWRERNARTFEDVWRSTDQLIESFVNSLFDWSRIWGFTTTNYVPEFVVSLHSVSCTFWCICCFPQVHVLCTLRCFFNTILITYQKKDLWLSCPM